MGLTRSPRDTTSTRIPGGKMGKALVFKSPSPQPQGKVLPRRGAGRVSRIKAQRNLRPK